MLSKFSKLIKMSEGSNQCGQDCGGRIFILPIFVLLFVSIYWHKGLQSHKRAGKGPLCKLKNCELFDFHHEILLCQKFNHTEEKKNRIDGTSMLEEHPQRDIMRVEKKVFDVGFGNNKK
jgi:hypothetical protein